MTAVDAPTMDAPDLERRFGALRRLYGAAHYERIRAATVAVVGIGGVGSWAAEALARSGIARLVLIDMDHVAESNINRQVQADSATIGRAKVEAMGERVRVIHPSCELVAIDTFAGAENWPALLPDGVDGVIEACDDVRAKAAIAAWARDWPGAFVGVGAAGGRQRPQDVELADLSAVTHDPLLASLRQRLRRDHAAPRQGPMNLRCVFSREPVRSPDDPDCAVDGSLNCHGYGSSVTVTATFGFTAAAELLAQLKPGI